MRFSAARSLEPRCFRLEHEHLEIICSQQTSQHPKRELTGSVAAPPRHRHAIKYFALHNDPAIVA
jgi:hypothetical protein